MTSRIPAGRGVGRHGHGPGGGNLTPPPNPSRAVITPAFDLSLFSYKVRARGVIYIYNYYVVHDTLAAV